MSQIHDGTTLDGNHTNGLSQAQRTGRLYGPTDIVDVGRGVRIKRRKVLGRQVRKGCDNALACTEE